MSQSLLEIQFGLHAPATQRNPLQEVLWGGGAQPPDPLHVPESTLSWSVEQLLQVSPAWVWQADPSAAQMALFPQAASVGQRVAQQTIAPVPLLTQLLLAHSPPAVQTAPFDFLTQLPFTQT